MHGNSDSGRPSETDITDKMLYELACIFFGSVGFSKNPSALNCLIDLRSRYQEAEANVLLISIAATIRRRSETITEYEKNLVIDLGLDNVGKYYRVESDENNVIPLKFREACNKIIHANKTEFSYHPNTGVLSPNVKLYGSQKGRNWSAYIEISTFIQSAWHHG